MTKKKNITKGVKSMPSLIAKDRKKGDLEKYCGHYVATRDFSDSTVVSYGDNPSMVRSEAEKRGADDPVIFFVPKKGMVGIY